MLRGALSGERSLEAVDGANVSAEYFGGEIDAIASRLAKSDIVCLSSMSIHAEYTKGLIRAVRTKNPAVFVVWGGIHCIVDPEDAITEADAVCIGEGEKAFPQLLSLLSEGKGHTGVGNFYFKANDRIIRNPLLPLQTSAEMESLPYPLYADRELLYRHGRGFIPLTLTDYVRHEGLTYNILWAIGCPNRCVYCGNSRFLKNDAGYARLRYRSVDYLLGEIKYARGRAPHLSAVTFQDDCFMSIPFPILEEFAAKWRKEIGLPFAVTGLISRNVDPRQDPAAHRSRDVQGPDGHPVREPADAEVLQAAGFGRFDKSGR